MSDDLITLTIEGQTVQVPPGTLIVDAAKQIEHDIPVFCYHPKLDPVGMCRMCLVEIGRPIIDRETGKPALDEEGNPMVEFRGNLETACTTPVGEGWEVRIGSALAIDGRREIVEHLLTSHPLDCPVCDKGGECPLQELTMDHGPGKSRFIYDDKIHLDKRVPLGELIYLDRERCIQCARCTRFQAEIVDDPVIGFFNRGRRLEIVTFSDPGFDSYFSGNTTDICPVGALTTSDFRFGARPWELNHSASICPHCPVGCNLTMNTRREAKSGGESVIKRVMPRQNESVNEIWICDKGRFGHHFATSPERVLHPMIRQDGELVQAGWEQALKHAAQGLNAAGDSVVGLAGRHLANEDYFALGKLINGLGGRASVQSSMGGAEAVRQLGIAGGSNLGELGRGDVILVVATDLHEEAPIWWLRVKQGAERGADLILVNARATRLDAYAAVNLRAEVGGAAHVVLGIQQVLSVDQELKQYADGEDLQRAAELIGNAKHLVTFFGSEGLDAQASEALASACAGLQVASGHAGERNSGLIPVWPGGNVQGALDAGLTPAGDLFEPLERAKAAYLIGAEAPQHVIERLDFLVVQELFLTDSARRADVILPAQSFVEREGTYTSGERRVQRFYRVLRPAGESRPDWQITAQLGAELGVELESGSVAAAFSELAASNPAYAELDFQKLSESKPEWPAVGGDDFYFGGTSYRNRQGLGAQTTTAADRGEQVEIKPLEPKAPAKDGTRMVPITKLYARGVMLARSELLEGRFARPEARLNPQDAAELGADLGSSVRISANGRTQTLPVVIDPETPRGAVLVPGAAGRSPAEVVLELVEAG